MHRVVTNACVCALAICLSVTTGGCKTSAPMAETATPALITQSDEARAARKQLAAVPLEDRIKAIEADLHRVLTPVGDGVLAPHYINHDGSKGPFHVELNIALLTALSAKYAATNDQATKTLAEKLIKGLLEMDARTGALDGLIAFELIPHSLEPTPHPTNANVYTQLLFAYALADKWLGPNDDIRRHVSLIYQRFVNDRFHLRQRDGTVDPRADVNIAVISFNARRSLDRKLLDTAAEKLGDDATRELVKKHRWKGATAVPKRVKLINIEIPTTSSSWLNLQALTALSVLGEDFQKDAIALAESYEPDRNPFFKLLAAMNGSQNVNLADVRNRLAEFPYPATYSGIINSHRKDIEVVRGDYVKFRSFAETRVPLPLYEIGSTDYLWKQRLRKIDSTPADKPLKLLGYDLYQAYWFLRAMESQGK